MRKAILLTIIGIVALALCGMPAFSQEAPELPPEMEAPPPMEEAPLMELAPEEAPPAEMPPMTEEAPPSEAPPAVEETPSYESVEVPQPLEESVEAPPPPDAEPAGETTPSVESALLEDLPPPAEEGADEALPPEEAAAELIELKPDEGIPGRDLARPEAAREGLISVTLDNVPLQDVVRMFARISGANIVSGTNLIGAVTVSLKDVEWQPALRTILDTAGMTLVMKSPGIYSVVSKAEAAAAPVTLDTVYLKFTTVSNVLPIVQRMLISSNSSAAAFPSANAIVVQETSERLASIKEMIERIDKPRSQVFIEAKFVELNDEAIKNLGINWQSLAGYTISAKDLLWSVREDRNYRTGRTETWDQYDQRRRADGVNRAYDIDGIAATEMEGPVSFQNLSVDGTVGRSIVDTMEQGQDVRLEIEDSFTKTVADARTAVLSAADFQVTLSALKQETGVSVVSNPRIIVASGETAKIHVGRKDPNYVTKQEPGPASGTTITKRELSETLPFIETGVRVSVLPTVNTESNITMRIMPELSRVLEGGLAGDIPPIITRTIVSEFNLESGRTVAIGGLTSTDDREVVSKVPLLGDIPLIGKYLFRHTRTEKKQDEVIIFVTVGLASAEMLQTSAGIPSEGQLIHRHLAREATRVQASTVGVGRQ